MAEVRWLPLESNPDVMTQFLVKLGLSPDWSVVDVIGFDDELLAFVPQPIAALILLFPTSQADSAEAGDASLVDKVFYMKQTIHNACGTIALLHAVGNNLDKMEIAEDSLLRKFFDATAAMSPEERGKELEMNSVISTSHESSAQEGQTAAPNINENIDYHFVAFVERGGRLYQLDGRKMGPIDHGPTTADALLTDAAKVCREFFARNPNCISFTSVALVKNAQQE